jgi:hypothetical protein
LRDARQIAQLDVRFLRFGREKDARGAASPDETANIRRRYERAQAPRLVLKQAGRLLRDDERAVIHNRVVRIEPLEERDAHGLRARA